MGEVDDNTGVLLIEFLHGKHPVQNFPDGQVPYKYEDTPLILNIDTTTQFIDCVSCRIYERAGPRGVDESHTKLHFSVLGIVSSIKDVPSHHSR